ncbi:MAG: sugar phosphatase [Enterobacteriaceae bacterium]
MTQIITCKGFLFDLDGTLVDSLAVVERQWCLFADKYAIDRAQVLAFIHGKQAITSLRHFMQGATEEEIAQEFKRLELAEATDTEGISALPGALELLHHLNEMQIPWGIVTSGTIPIATARSRVAGIPLPKLFITAEQVSKGKPAPEPYLLGARQLGFAPPECVVVEDAQAGLQSGLQAGCQVVAVHAPAEIPELAQVAMTFTSLTQIEVKRQGDNVIVTRK